MTDMTEKIFENTDYGKIALQKFGFVSDNFRIYEAGWIGNNPSEFNTMKVIGGEFRIAKSGKNEGKLSILIPNSSREVYITKDEMND